MTAQEMSQIVAETAKAVLAAMPAQKPAAAVTSTTVVNGFPTALPAKETPNRNNRPSPTRHGTLVVKDGKALAEFNLPSGVVASKDSKTQYHRTSRGVATGDLATAPLEIGGGVAVVMYRVFWTNDPETVAKIKANAF